MTGHIRLSTPGVPATIRARAAALAVEARGTVLSLGSHAAGLTWGAGTQVRHVADPAALDGIGPVDTVVAVCDLWRPVWTRARLTALRAALEPTGQLLFLEPVRVTGASGAVQRLAGPALRMAYGVGFDRVVLDDLRSVGLVPISVDRLHPNRWGRVASFVTGAAVPR